jgi:hypothetical protein
MLKKLKPLVSLALAGSLLAFGGNAALAEPEMTLKFAGQNATDHPATDMMNKIAKEVGERTESYSQVWCLRNHSQILTALSSSPSFTGSTLSPSLNFTP